MVWFRNDHNDLMRINKEKSCPEALRVIFLNYLKAKTRIKAKVRIMVKVRINVKVRNKVKIKVKVGNKIKVRVKFKVRIRVKADSNIFVSIFSVKGKVCIHVCDLFCLSNRILKFFALFFVEAIFNPHKSFCSFSLS